MLEFHIFNCVLTWDNEKNICVFRDTCTPVLYLWTSVMATQKVGSPFWSLPSSLLLVWPLGNCAVSVWLWVSVSVSECESVTMDVDMTIAVSVSRAFLPSWCAKDDVAVGSMGRFWGEFGEVATRDSKWVPRGSVVLVWREGTHILGNRHVAFGRHITWVGNDGAK